jgi:hypothetical protein
MSVLGTDADGVIELVVHLVDLLVEPRGVQGSVAPVEHQIFTENHEHYLK